MNEIGCLFLFHYLRKSVISISKDFKMFTRYITLCNKLHSDIWKNAGYRRSIFPLEALLKIFTWTLWEKRLYFMEMDTGWRSEEVSMVLRHILCRSSIFFEEFMVKFPTGDFYMDESIWISIQVNIFSREAGFEICTIKKILSKVLHFFAHHKVWKLINCSSKQVM